MYIKIRTPIDPWILPFYIVHKIIIHNISVYNHACIICTEEVHKTDCNQETGGVPNN